MIENIFIFLQSKPLPETIAQAAIVIGGIVSVYFLNIKGPRHRWGHVFALSIMPAWFYTSWLHDQWGIFIRCMIFSVLWTMGIYNFWIKPSMRKKTDD